MNETEMNETLHNKLFDDAVKSLEKYDKSRNWICILIFFATLSELLGITDVLYDCNYALIAANIFSMIALLGDMLSDLFGSKMNIDAYFYRKGIEWKKIIHWINYIVLFSTVVAISSILVLIYYTIFINI